jgi:cell division septum initiation protein DivIVA
MTAGRKPKNVDVVDVIDPSLDQTKITGAMVQMRADGVADRLHISAETFDLGRRVGAMQLARVQRNFLQTAEIRLFEDMKNFKDFKDLAIRDEAGNVCQAENIDELCNLVFGRGYKAVNEDSLTFRALGDGAYDAANRLGLNRKQLRLIRSLPDAQRTAVAEAIQAESKSEVVAIIEDLAAQLAQAQDDATDAREEVKAREAVIADKNAAADKLRTKLKRVQAAPPDVVLQELQKEASGIASEAMTCVRGMLRQALIAIKNHSEADHTIFMAGLVGQVQADLTMLREEFALPDISNAVEQELASQVAQWAPKKVQG